VASIIISALLMLSGILMATTLFPEINVTVLTFVAGAVLVAVLLAFGVAQLVRRKPQPVGWDRRRREREEWTMPPLALLDRPSWSPMRTFAVGALCVYLVVAILLLLLKSVELAIGR
jgi:amino acid transporter